MAVGWYSAFEPQRDADRSRDRARCMSHAPALEMAEEMLPPDVFRWGHLDHVHRSLSLQHFVRRTPVILPTEAQGHERSSDADLVEHHIGEPGRESGPESNSADTTRSPCSSRPYRLNPIAKVAFSTGHTVPRW